jgi:hypothetical protein
MLRKLSLAFLIWSITTCFMGILAAAVALVFLVLTGPS